VSGRIAWSVAAVLALLIVAGLLVHPVTLDDGGYQLPSAIPFTVVGALLASKRPSNPLGWLFLGFGAVATVAFAAGAYAFRELEDGPSRAGDVAAAVAAHIWHPGFGLLVFAFLLFPNGRLLSPRWRWMAAVVAFTYGGLLLSGPFESEFASTEGIAGARPLFDGPVSEVASLVFGVLLTLNLLLLAIAALSLLLRLKRSRGDERQQVKWFVYTVAFVMLFFPVSVMLIGDGGAGVFLFPLIPASAAVAVLKYRLYDIDVVINRTLVYGALTATLGAAYLGAVLVLQLVLEPVTERSGLAIAASTLVVAALFGPARRRIQELVDRRFYRHKYDATRTIDDFGARLRDEVGLDALASDLRAVVADTMQPAHVSLWLRNASRTPPA
jgi:hypothetical protein